MGGVGDIRDFVYLDVERVRSFVAQTRGGVPTERTSGDEHQAGAETSAAGGIPWIAKIEGQADYHYVRSATETRSVQDAIFEEFVSSCRPLDVSALESWPDLAAAKDGQLVSAHGHIKFVDYQTSLDALRAFPKMIAAYQRFSSGTSTAPTALKSQQLVKAGSPTKAQADTIGPIIESMSKLVGTNLSDFVRVKVVPDINRPAEALVGDGHRSLFRYHSAILTALYPGGTAEGWHCVGIVHRPTASSLAGAQGNETMGDMLESLLDQMGGLEAFRQAARPPAIAITPLAIYRTLVHG